MTILVPIGDERQFDNKRISILLNNGIPMGYNSQLPLLVLLCCKVQITL